MGSETLTTAGVAGGFRHEALLYAGEEQFLDATVEFIANGLAQDEPVLVAVSPRKISMLRANLGWDGQWVEFVDMDALGSNPGRIISAWRRFVHDHRHHAHLRGVGEPIWAARRPAELVECQQHERLLNGAFPSHRPWRLLCPYDTSALPPEVVAEAERAHPFVQQGHHHGPSLAHHLDDRPLADLLEAPLPEPRGSCRVQPFDARTYPAVQPFVAAAARALSAARLQDLARALEALLDNSLRHGGGAGTVRVWEEQGAVVCEVRDGGHLIDPLAGRGLPPNPPTAAGGLWLVHQVCDLVQVRSSTSGTVVRISMRTG